MAGGRRGAGGAESEGRGSSGRGEWEVFGRRVEELRSAAGLTPSDLTMREVLSAAELREIERGTTVPTRCTAGYLDRRTGAKGRLVNSWARATINTHLADGSRPHELDRSAHTIREFSPGTIPSPLRSHDYTTALGRFYGHGTPRDGVWNRLDDLRVVVNETAMRTPVGGPEVMREQLRRIVGSIRHSGLRLQIVPQCAVEHPCPMGPFRLLSLGPAYTVAHVLAPCGDGQLVTAPSEVQAFSDLFEDLRAAALPTADSLDLLTEVAAGMETNSAPKAIGSGHEENQIGGVSALSSIAR